MVIIIYLQITLPEWKWQMNEPAAKAVSMSSEACASGAAQEASGNMRCGLRWGDLLKPENGGPGEPPGRTEAIERTKVRIGERIAKFGQKKAKGSSKAKGGLAVGRGRAKELGL